MIGGTSPGMDGLASPLTKFSLLKRRAGTTRAAFVGHWRTVHVDVLVNKARHKAYNKRYVQNEFLDLAGFEDQRFDGAAQMIPQSAQLVRQGFQNDPLYAKYVRPDEQLFLDVAGCVVLYCETSEVGSVGGCESPLKAMALVGRAPGTDPVEFNVAWKRRAQVLLDGARHSGMRAFRQHWVMQGAATRMLDGEVLQDAPTVVEEMFFDDVDVMSALCTSEAFIKGFDQCHALAPSHGSYLFAAREHLVYEGA
ncbi:MAG: EthD domain-containing protein [Rhodoferax sp.]|nr:EthD domain-containing protein [Rhodoferax sp.]